MSQDKSSEHEDAGTPFFSHLEELRSRLVKSALALAATFSVAYHFSRTLMDVVEYPLIEALPKGSSLTYLSVTEGFLTELKISILGGVFLACPIWFYQIWKFIAPGLYQKERRYAFAFVGGASVFFLLGAAFNYFFSMPFGLKFLLSYAAPENQGLVPITANISYGAYFSFFITMTLAFGAIFELPVVVFFLARMGIINYRTLTRARGIAIIGIFIVAAILTPPDVFSQLLMAGPLLVLYELSILVAYLFGERPPKEEPKEDDGEDEAQPESGA